MAIEFPYLVTRHIFSLLDYQSLKAVRQVCKTWRLFLEEQRERSLWKRFIEIESPMLKTGLYRDAVPISEESKLCYQANILEWKNLAMDVKTKGSVVFKKNEKNSVKLVFGVKSESCI